MADLSTRLTLNSTQFDRNITKSTLLIHRFKNAAHATSQSVGMFAAKFTGAATVTDFAIRKISLAIHNYAETIEKFEKSMSMFQGILGVSTDQMKYFEQEAVRLGGLTTQTASLVAEAFTKIAGKLPQLLGTKEGLVLVTEAAITLAEAGGIGVEEAGKALADSINLMGASATEAYKYINVLAAGSRNGAGNIEYLNKAMEKVGGIAATAGVSFEQLVAVIETIAPKVTAAESAGIQLRLMFLALEKTSDNNIKPSMVGISKALENLAKKELTLAEYAKIFDQRAVIVAKTLVDNREKFEQLTKAVTDTNTAFDLAKTNTDNLAGAYNRLDSAWEDFQLTVLGFSWKGFIDGSAKVVNNLTEMYLKLTAIDQWEARHASKKLGKDWPLVQGRLEQILKNYTNTTNPNTGQNYTLKEAAQYIKDNYKDLMPEYGLWKIDDDYKVGLDNKINDYLDTIISKLEVMSDREKARRKELKELAELLALLDISLEEYYKKLIEIKKEELALAQSYQDRYIIQKEIDDLQNKANQIKYFEAEPIKGSIASLRKEIADLRKDYENAATNADRKRIHTELKDRELKLQGLEFVVKLDYDNKKIVEPNVPNFSSLAKVPDTSSMDAEINRIKELRKEIEKLQSLKDETLYNNIMNTSSAFLSFGDTINNLLNTDWSELNAWEQFVTIADSILSTVDSIKNLIDIWKEFNDLVKLISTGNKMLLTTDVAATTTAEAEKAAAVTAGQATLTVAVTTGSAVRTAALKAEMAAGSAAAYAYIPFAGVGLAAGQIAQFEAMILAAAAVPTFADGGIIQSPFTSGDKNLVRVNGGEMVLNRGQQSNLFNLLDRGGSAINGGEVEFKIRGKELVGVLNNYNTKVNKLH